MQVVYERCCGLDVHKAKVVACLLAGKQKEIQTFTTMTEDLLRLATWLTDVGCTHVAMESTGVYWKPVYNLLEETGMTVLVVNARHIKAVPGRKTDVKDAEWIADLLRHGLLRGSFIPDRPQRELQELIHYRRSLIDERTREVNRIQKVLEGANIKLSAAISDVVGVGGRKMLGRIVEGETDPEAIVGAVQTKHLKATQEELKRSVQGFVGPHQRMMLEIQLEHIDSLNDKIAYIDAALKERMHPFADQIARLDTIPGINVVGAQEIIAAIGTDMSRFPTAKHLASWAKLCPGTNESAGKRGSGATGKGNPYIRTTLAEAAWGASHTKDTYLRAQYYRIRMRKGEKRAVIAVGHSILVIVYNLLKYGGTYNDLGGNYFDEHSKEAATRQAVRRLERLGHKVTLESAA
jgi:transposase